MAEETKGEERPVAGSADEEVNDAGAAGPAAEQGEDVSRASVAAPTAAATPGYDMNDVEDSSAVMDTAGSTGAAEEIDDLMDDDLPSVGEEDGDGGGLVEEDEDMAALGHREEEDEEEEEEDEAAAGEVCDCCGVLCGCHVLALL